MIPIYLRIGMVRSKSTPEAGQEKSAAVHSA